MKACCIILALAVVAALAFGLSAVSSLGALQAQVADLTAQLSQAQADLTLSEEINQAFEKERVGLKDTIGKLQNGQAITGAGEPLQPPQSSQGMDAPDGVPAA